MIVAVILVNLLVLDVLALVIITQCLAALRSIPVEKPSSREMAEELKRRSDAAWAAYWAQSPYRCGKPELHNRGTPCPICRPDGRRE